MSEWRPFPRVGARIKLDYGPSNVGTWRCAGEVRAIVDGWAMDGDDSDVEAIRVMAKYLPAKAA